MLPLEHPMNKVKFDNLRDWCGVSEYVKIWDYMLYGTTPEANVDAIAADARLFKRLGIKDVFMESEFHYQPFYDMHVYLMSELYFDPDQDADALVGRWCRVYGSAAPKMLEAVGFLRELERTEIPKDLQAWHMRNLPWYTAENLERFRALCREAYVSADTPAARQRIAIAMALESQSKAGAYEPSVRNGIIVADEPTTSLDSISQRSVVDYIEYICDKGGKTLLYVSHNLGILQHLCDNLMVMKDGVIIEQGRADDLFFRARKSYTKAIVRETLNVMGKTSGGMS